MLKSRLLNKSETTWWLLALLPITAAVFWCFHPYLFVGFWEDDFTFVRTVPAFRFSLLPELFSPFRGWFYRPAFLTYFSLVRAVFGPNPVAFHAASLILHAVNLWLLVLLMRRLGGSGRTLGLACVGAVIGVLLYRGIAMSGLSWGDNSISAVVWVSSASTLLAALFSLLTFHAWLSFRRRKNVRFYGAALVFFFLALVSKEDAATLPLALLALEFVIRRDGGTPALKLALFLPFVCVFALFVYLDVTAYRQLDVFNGKGLSGPLNPARYRLAMAFLNQSFFSLLSSNGFWVLTAFVSLIVWAWRYDQTLVFFLMWLFLLAFPTTLTSGPHSMAARFFYLPGLAACAASALLLRHLAGEKQFDKHFVPIALIVAFCALKLGEFLFGFISDPLWHVGGLLMGFAGAWFLCRSGIWPFWMFPLAAICIIGPQCEVFSTGEAVFWPWPVLILGTVIAVACWKKAPVGALSICAFSMGVPSLFWPLFVGANAFWFGLALPSRRIPVILKKSEV